MASSPVQLGSTRAPPSPRTRVSRPTAPDRTGSRSAATPARSPTRTGLHGSRRQRELGGMSRVAAPYREFHRNQRIPMKANTTTYPTQAKSE
ncbi:hypothetical protein J2S92_001559 [Arthrobacter bambusae]|nr:hypothetical protein [Arthrobacter bambusae]MDQ0236011.1 hypothetical protein [Arthrobacter bambusae]